MPAALLLSSSPLNMEPMACHPVPSQKPAASADGDEVIRPLSQDVVATLVANHREFLDFLTRRVSDRALAEDLLQEAFVRGLDRIETLRDGESVVAWFYRSLRNAVIDSYRRRGATTRRLEALARELEQSTEPDAELAQSVCKCVARLADTLKPEYAAALKRIEVDGLSVQAFAEESGVTAGNAAVRVFRARQALRKQVTVTCGTCADHGCLDCHCGTPAP
jgi:RNA polymerase sigma factor (sigma-70 family)